MSRFFLPLVSLTLGASALLLQGCNGTTATDFDLSTADGATKSQFAHLRNDTIADLVKENLTTAQYAQLAAKWDSERNKEKNDEETAQFKKQIDTIISGAFIDDTMPMVEAQLAQVTKEQVSGGILMFGGMALGNDEIGLSEAEKADALKLLTGLSEWVKTSNVMDPAATRTALVAVQKMVVDLNVTSLDQATQLTFDEALAKIDILSAGIKKALAAYNLDVNEILDSVVIKKVTGTSDNADTVSIKITLSIFGNPFSSTTQLSKIDGIWHDAKSAVAIADFFKTLK